MPSNGWGEISGLGPEILIRKHRFLRLLNHDGNLACADVAGVASFRQLTVRLGIFAFVLQPDGLAEIIHRLPDEGLDHLHDLHLSPLRPDDREALERFIQLVQFVSGVDPILFASSNPELDVTRLHRRCHEIAETRSVGRWSVATLGLRPDAQRGSRGNEREYGQTTHRFHHWKAPERFEDLKIA